MFLDPISNLPGFHPYWIPRVGGVDVLGDREFALRQLAPHHDAVIAAAYPHATTRHHAEQVHGNRIAVITTPSSEKSLTHPDVDGLVTDFPNQVLAIYVADCAAIYLADPEKCAIALIHSGRKGTEENILGNAVATMKSIYGTNPAKLICVVSPCIRPPNYEVDIASMISAQASALGIVNFHDSCENTATDLSRHYSYRMEKSQTGRMLALLSINA